MAKDIIHFPVKKAIEKAGWIVTNDQYTVQFAEFTMYADLAAERVIAAQRGKDVIAIEQEAVVIWND
jgi:XisH protein